jgi:hypothetical protein
MPADEPNVDSIKASMNHSTKNHSTKNLRDLRVAARHKTRHATPATSRRAFLPESVVIDAVR